MSRATSGKNSLFCVFCELRGDCRDLCAFFDVESDGTHQRDRVAPGNRPRLQEVIESQLALREPVVEMNVDGTRRKFVDYSGHRQIVRGHQADRALPDEATKHAGGTNQAVVRVGTVKKLVEQEQQMWCAASGVGQSPDARDLGVEARPPLL